MRNIFTISVPGLFSDCDAFVTKAVMNSEILNKGESNEDGLSRDNIIILPLVGGYYYN